MYIRIYIALILLDYHRTFSSYKNLDDMNILYKGLFSNADFPINPRKRNAEGVTDPRDSVTDCI